MGRTKVAEGTTNSNMVFCKLKMFLLYPFITVPDFTVLGAQRGREREYTYGDIERDRTRALSRTPSKEKPTFHRAFVIFAPHYSQDSFEHSRGPARCLFIHTRNLVVLPQNPSLAACPKAPAAYRYSPSPIT